MDLTLSLLEYPEGGYCHWYLRLHTVRPMKTMDMCLGSPKAPSITVSISAPGVEDLRTNKRVWKRQIREEFVVCLK
jgi:hypothetical protein